MGNKIFKKFLGIALPVLLSLLIAGPVQSAGNEKDDEIISADNWYLQSGENAGGSGREISSEGFPVDKWFHASVPSTVMGILVRNNVYKDLFTGDNLRKVPLGQFTKPWWYRTEFVMPAGTPGKKIILAFDGIVYRANIWFNGKLIAGSNSIRGVFRRFELDVTREIKHTGKNILAVEVIPAIAGEPSLGFADWNPRPPDNSLGLWRKVSLKILGDVSISNPYIQSKIDLKTFKRASLKVSAELTNNTLGSISGTLTGNIGRTEFAKTITIGAGENRKVEFDPEEYKQLNLQNPRIWWPHNLGRQPLYKLNIKFVANGKITSESEKRFGIREVQDYINKDGFRGYIFNGRKIQILGGGWVDDIFLENKHEKMLNQIRYVKHMGLNAIRLEGFWGTDEDLYDICDELGILIMAGWSCQWENDEYIGKHVDEFGGIESKEDIELIAQSWQDQIKWLRNHPSIFLWLYGSDRLPRPELEKKYLAIMKQCDTTRPLLGSVQEYVSSVTGPTAVKMRGPYSYVPPLYWWSDRQKGGAFGFNTEQGPGAQVPALESVLKMIPAEHLWPIDSVWNYHCATGTFNNLKDYNSAIARRLGEPDNLEEYCTKAQYINYENTRAMYEAIEANKYTSTGAIHWMLNSAWPKLYWQLYDYYMMPAGAFYGIRKARENVHIIYDYASDAVLAVNNTDDKYEKLSASIKIFDMNMKERFSQTIQFGLSPDGKTEILKLPVIQDLSKTYFVDLRILHGEKMMSSNFYCLSTQKDILDSENSTWYMTPVKQLADLRDLNELGNVTPAVKQNYSEDKATGYLLAEITNTSDKPALQVVLTVKKGSGDESVVPVFWDDNYISLLPGETRVLRASFEKKYLNGQKPRLEISGWNIK